MASVLTGVPSRQTESGRAEAVFGEMPDRQLVDRIFAAHDDFAELAFAELIRRHGPMVFGVCRQLLRDTHDAEDAFQATFLVFVRKARTIRRPELLGPWLHGVAVRVARKAKSLNERRRRYEAREATMWEAEPVDERGQPGLGIVRREEVEALHEELARLPEKYRLPVVLCDLGGLTHREAAGRLSWPAGTVSVRLMRARQLLRRRLLRRGLTTAGALFVTATVARTALATVPSCLARATVQAGLRAAGRGLLVSGVSPLVQTLTREVTTSFARAKLVAVATGAGSVLVVAVLALMAIGSCERQLAVGGPRATQSREAWSGPPNRATMSRMPAQGAGASTAPTVRATRAPADVALRNVPIEVPGVRDRIPNQGSGKYATLARQAGRDAHSQVQLALWCEADGLEHERTKHLALAVLADPNDTAARGLLGQLTYEGRWRHAESVPDLVRGKTSLAAALDDYLARRRKMPNTADAHWKLAVWCEQQGLKAEATAHFVAVTRLAPDHEAAWARLGRKRLNGRWLTEAQLAAERAEARSQRDGSRRWKPLLTKWRAWLADKDRRDEAQQALASVTDSHAVSSVWDLFVASDRPDHDRAVRLFGQIDAPAATWALGVLAIASPSSSVRKAACETLVGRDARVAIGLLVGLLRDPLPNPKTVFYRFECLPIGILGVGSPGVSLLETRGANFVRFYTVDEVRNWPLQAMTGLSLPPFGQNYEARVTFQRFRQMRELGQGVRQANDDAVRDVLPVAVSINEFNAAIIQGLRNITSQDQGASWQAWRRWWTEDLGYAYDPEQDRSPTDLAFFEPKPTFVSTAHTSCFAGGTSVKTLTGPRPIEVIRMGDQVLTQDTTTGALRFEPVLAIYHNAPTPTVRIQFDDASIVATGIHRFWNAGNGWVMARDLKSGDTVRTLGGLARVSAVSADSVRPVFNLEVNEGRSFFVGLPAALVHDNSVVQPVREPFDRTVAPADDDGH